MLKLQGVVRPLSPSERRLLSAELKRRRHLAESFTKRTAGGALIVCGILSAIVAISRFREKGSVVIALILWIGISSAFYTWERFTTKPKLNRQVARFAEAIGCNNASVVHIRSDAVVAFAEVKNEGVCYAFQIDNGQIVFVSGWNYSPSVKFPNDDFLIVHVLDGENGIVQEFVEKKGEKLQPKRIIPASLKLKLRIPEHLEVIEGSLDQLESLLSK